MDNLGTNVKRGFFWNFAENVLYKIVQFLLQIILARILLPEDYGLCAIVLAFINIAQEFVNSGFASALIQKKEASRLDFSSVCYFSIALGILFYFILFAAAPSLASFFNDERIIGIMRIMGLSLIIGAFNSVQTAIVYKRLEFRKSFIANLVSISISAVLGIFSAIKGWGVWALVIQYMSNRVVNTITFFFLVRWLPNLEFSFKSIKQLFSYGWKLMLTSLLSFLSQDIYSLVIGKFFSKSQLGLYDLGNKIPANLANTVASTVGRVLFPTLSAIQEDTSKIKEYVKRTNQLACFVMFPLMFGIAATAKPIVLLVFTEKWADAIIIMQIACIWYAFNPIHYANIQVSKAIGRSDISLLVELSKKLVDIIMLLITVRYGLVYVALGLAVSSIIGLWINIEPIKKYIGYSTIGQLKDIYPSFITGFVMFVTIYLFNTTLSFSPMYMLLYSIVLGSSIWIVMAKLLNNELLMLFLSRIKR